MEPNKGQILITRISHWFRGLRRWQQFAVVFTIVILVAAPFSERSYVSEKPTPTSTPTPKPTPACAQVGDRVYLYSRPQVNLQGCDFSNRKFQRMSEWGEADLRGADFSGASLSYADFSFADLTSANFSGAFLEGADFTNANVRGANFDGAVLKCILEDGTNRLSDAINVQILSVGSCFD
jgi:uncharacterized protein YjbI with pentapeptide repeats